MISPSIGVIGPFPPPVGGVSRAIEEAINWARGVGWDVALVNTSGSQAVRNLWALYRCMTTDFNVINISTASKAKWVRMLSVVLPHPVVFIHGSMMLKATAAELSHLRSASSRATLWVNNDRVRAWLKERIGVEASLVSPAIQVTSVAPPSLKPTEAVVAIYRDDIELYGLDDLREAWLQIANRPTLYLLSYGSATVPETVKRFVIEFPGEIRLVHNITSAEVSELLQRCGFLLRPTMTDGDSLLVREAVALGCRVVASDVVPRPSGVEIASSLSDYVEALKGNRLRRSDGDGLGDPLDQALMLMAEEACAD